MVLYTLTHLPDFPHVVPFTSRDMTTVSKMDPTIVVGMPRLRFPRQNPLVGSVLSKANKGRDKVTQRM
jgi:hypothetical protein